jgi:hypothetical protein
MSASLYAADGRSRAANGPRPLSPELQDKLDRAERRLANRRRLSRILRAVARIAAELEHGLREERRVAFASSEYCREAVLLREVKSLRFDLDRLDIQ